MRKQILVVGILAVILSSSLVSTMKIDFFYSPFCSHCQNVMPTIQILKIFYTAPYFKWNTYDVTQGSYDVNLVPTIKIKTDECRNITIIGDTLILKQLPCELQQKTSKKCPTYSANENIKGESWFIN